MLKVSVIGHIGQDAVVKEFQSAKYVAFSIAHSESWTDQQGTKHEKTEWISCLKRIYFDNSGLVKFLTKGTKVYVEGQLSKKIYEKSGKQEAGLNCNVSHLELLSHKKEEVPASSEPLKGEPMPITEPNIPQDSGEGDDLPF